MLARIAANTSKLIVERKQNLGFEKLGELAMETATPPSFIDALETQQKLGNLSVIAECKAQSPSAGVIREDYDPGAVSREYQQHGAHCISVLTEPDFFGGSDDHINQVRTACGLPVLRKDFMLDTYQIVEARAIGASAILVILAMTRPECIAAIGRGGSRLWTDRSSRGARPSRTQGVAAIARELSRSGCHRHQQPQPANSENRHQPCHPAGKCRTILGFLHC